MNKEKVKLLGIARRGQCHKIKGQPQTCMFLDHYLSSVLYNQVQAWTGLEAARGNIKTTKHTNPTTKPISNLDSQQRLY